MGTRPVAAEQAETLKIGVAQIVLESSLSANRDKIEALIQQAKNRGCRVVVFPETALFCPPNTPTAEVDAATETLRQVVDKSDLYALIGGLYQRGANAIFAGDDSTGSNMNGQFRGRIAYSADGNPIAMILSAALMLDWLHHPGQHTVVCWHS